MEDKSTLHKTQEIIDSEIKCFLDRVKNSNRIWVRQTMNYTIKCNRG